MSTNSGLIEAPPTRNPSISASLAVNTDVPPEPRSAPPSYKLLIDPSGPRRLTQLSAVLAVDTSSVDDPDLLGNVGGDVLADPFSETGVNILGLLRGLLNGTGNKSDL